MKEKIKEQQELIELLKSKLSKLKHIFRHE